jgi:hypothetical protein
LLNNVNIKSKNASNNAPLYFNALTFKIKNGQIINDNNNNNNNFNKQSANSIINDKFFETHITNTTNRFEMNESHHHFNSKLGRTISFDLKLNRPFRVGLAMRKITQF